MLPIWGTSSPSADVIEVLSLHCIEIEWREYRNSCLGSMVCLDYLATSISRQRTPCPVPSSSQHNNHHPNAVSNISHFSLRRCRVEVHPSSPESSKTSRRRWEVEGSRRESSAELEKFPSSYMSVTSYFVKSVTADLTYHRACVDTYTMFCQCVIHSMQQENVQPWSSWREGSALKDERSGVSTT